MRHARTAVAIVLAAALALPASVAHAAPRDSLTAHTPLLTRRDAAFALVSAAAVAAAYANDAWARRRALAADSRGARDAAHFAEHLGNSGVVAPALVAIDLAARASGRPAVGAASERMAISVGVAGLGAIALKSAFGRARPFESPADHASFKPFSGHDAFPSGHTAVAFAVAGALSGESHARWAPYLTLPLATFVGWSRVRDDKHWASDVVAGAAFGWWTARKADAIARRRLPDGLWVLVFPQPRGAAFQAQVRF